MNEVTEIEQNVNLIRCADRKFYLVGTAHVSKSSVELTERIIRKYSPDTVAVELCEARYASLVDPHRWGDTDVFNVIKSGKVYVLMAQLALASFQKKLGDQLDVKPGDEMRRAIDVAKETDAEIALVDRDVKVTLKRAWSKAGLLSLIKIIGSMIGSIFAPQQLDESDIENLKNSDALESTIAEFSSFLPGVKDALIDERDLYLSSKIFNAPGNTVVAVVGAGHIPGILRTFGQEIDLQPLETIPPARRSFQAIAWGIPAIILGLMAYGFVNAGADVSLQMVKAWILANGVLAALGALIALAHPLTVVTAFIAAPLTSLNPMIAAGWVCGLVETLLRKPRVRDLETLPEAITSVKGLWGNRVSKILLVIVLANIGSSIGTFIGFGKIASLL